MSDMFIYVMNLITYVNYILVASSLLQYIARRSKCRDAFDSISNATLYPAVILSDQGESYMVECHVTR